MVIYSSIHSVNRKNSLLDGIFSFNVSPFHEFEKISALGRLHRKRY